MTTDPGVNLQREKIIEKITKWLKEEKDFTVKPNPYPDRLTDSDSYWYAIVTWDLANPNLKLRVRLPSSATSPDSVTIEADMIFSPQDLMAFNRLKEPDKDKFINDLQVAVVVERGVRSLMIPDENDNPRLTRIWKEIYFDAPLTKHLFMTYVFDMLYAARIANAKFAEFQRFLWSQKNNDKKKKL